MTEIEVLLAKINAREAESVAAGTCRWYVIELCLPEVGCNKYLRRACESRAEAIKRGREYARAVGILPSGIRARVEG